MANEIKLEVYTFRLRKTNSDRKDDSYLSLDNIAGTDFYDTCINFLGSLDTLSTNEKLMKAIKIQAGSLALASMQRTISGVFQSGGYGIESEIYSLVSQQSKIKKEVEDVEIMPFYFQFFIPKKLNVGILILERIGIYGIHSILKECLREYLKGQETSIQIEINPLVSRELAEAFLNEGGVKEIVLRRYSLPTDIADLLTMREYEEKILSVELRIKAKGIFDGFSGRINRYLADPNASFFDIKQLRDIGFDNYTRISVVSQFDGNTRTLDLSESMQIRPYYHIDDKVVKINGHPTFETIHAEASSLLETLKSELK